MNANGRNHTVEQCPFIDHGGDRDPASGEPVLPG